MDPSERERDETVIKAELDELAVRILTLMNDYINCKRSIENFIRAGCLDLAKARYIAGNRNISALQLPGVDSVGVTARVRVSRSKSCDFSKFESIENSFTDEEIVAENLNELNLNSENDPSKRILRFSKDPLKWFGYLPPRSLKQSKLTFEKCLELVIECANIQSELEHNLSEYRKCKKLLRKS